MMRRIEIDASEVEVAIVALTAYAEDPDTDPENKTTASNLADYLGEL